MFDDGVEKAVNLRRFLRGPVFFVDHDAGTIVWPHEADFAPETLHGLPDERGDAA